MVSAKSLCLFINAKYYSDSIAINPDGVYYYKRGEIFMYIPVKQAVRSGGVSDRRVRILCLKAKSGVIREGRSWKIPEEAKKPEDGRYRSAESLLEMIDRKKAELDTRRPLTEGEVERLTEEFVVGVYL